jgi:tetratricopeptide (TPR) repeat protein/O-antigen ligase
MPKETSLAMRICDLTSKYSIYLLVFLLPIFFLPWTSNVFDFNKQTLLLVLVFISAFTWAIKTFISKELILNSNKTHIAVAVLFLVYLLSTIFSLWRYGSFWGWPQIISESLVSLIGLSLFYFLVSNLFNKKEIIQLIFLLSFSGLLSLIFGLLQLLGLFIIPLSFAKTASFNTIGTSVSLGFFVVALLPLIISLLISTRKKILEIILFGMAVLSIIILVVLNYSSLWWLAIIGSALLIIFEMQKRSKLNNRWLILPLFLLALSLFFVVLKPAIKISAVPAEVSLTHKTSFSIVLQTLKENPVLGSGPGTFSYDFMRYKSVDFNKNQFWSVDFNGATSKILTSLATTGVLGALALLLLIACVIFCGIKFFFLEKSAEDSYRNITLGVFIGFIVLSAGFLLRNSNLTLDFLYFFLIAAFVALAQKERKKYDLSSSSLITLIVNFAFILLFIFGLGLLILIGQKYIAEAKYSEGISQWQNGKIEEGLKNIEKAVGLNGSSDLYLRQLSQLYLSKLGQEISKTNISQDQKNKNIQSYVNNAINASKMASDINPKNANNWAARGFVYQNLLGIVPGAEDWAIKSYEEAKKLEPTNPYYPTREGIVFLTQSLSLAKDKQDEKSQLLLKAEEQLNAAIQLKSDYASARFQMAMVLQAEGKTDEAIKGLEQTKIYAPQDVGLAFQLGLLYYQNEDYQKAQIELERAIGISPNYSDALYFLGLTYSELGQKDKAIEKISKVAALNPDNETIKKVLANIEAGRKPLEGVGEGTL